MIERYTRPAMMQLWSDQHRLETWLAIELAACKAMEEEPLSIIPKGTSVALEKKAKALGVFDISRLQEIEKKTHHETVAFLQYLEEWLGESAKYLHFGLTSSDILDTGLAILLRQAGLEILTGLNTTLLPALSEKAQAHRHTAMIGRSHGIHAEPITTGVVFAGFYAEVNRSTQRLKLAVENISYGKLSGAVGIYGAGYLSPEGEARALGTLELKPETVATQVIPRDRHAEFFLALSLLAASIERIAVTVRHWQRTEVGEAEEAFSENQTGSSAMPHKKNPVLSENLSGLARLVRGEANISLENIALWHERDISHSSIERNIAPSITSTVDFMVHRASTLIKNLKINQNQMQKNLEITHGLFASEKVLLSLVEKGLSRKAAYAIVQRNAMAVPFRTSDIQFYDKLAEDAEIKNHLTLGELKMCFDLKHHLQYVDSIIDRALR